MRSNHNATSVERFFEKAKASADGKVSDTSAALQTALGTKQTAPAEQSEVKVGITILYPGSNTTDNRVLCRILRPRRDRNRLNTTPPSLRLP